MTSQNDGGNGIAVVCGSRTTIGKASVARFRSLGYEVATIDPADSGHDAASGRLAFAGDLTRDAIWAETSQALFARDRRPRFLVYGLSEPPSSGNPFDLSLSDWDTTISTNLRSAFLACKHLMPIMNGHDAAVVLVGSVLAYWDTIPDLAFGASQAGLLGLMRSLTLAGAPEGIRVNAVCAGLVDERDFQGDPVSDDLLKRIPLRRAASPDDVVDAITFFLSPDARHLSGSTLVVDGGQSLQSWSNTPAAGHFPDARPAPEAPSADPTHRFDGLTVLVTGAGGGIGSAACRRFASEGANLVLIDRDGPRLNDAADELSRVGAGVLPLEVDVTDGAAMESAFDRAEQHFGRLDVVFNNAGFGSSEMTIEETPIEHWDTVQAINFRGIFLGSKFAIGPLTRAGGGAIVNMGSSTARHDTISGGAAYMSSKAGVEALTKALALQVAQRGIRANTIAPGVIQTELSFRQQATVDPDRFEKFAARIPLRRVGQPEDVAATVAFLASHHARHITGATLLIDGGQTLTRWVSAPMG